MAMAVAAGLALEDGETSYCSWNPWTQVQEPLSCQLDLGETRQICPDRDRPTIASINDDWDGPHDCVGSYCLYTNQEFPGSQSTVVITTKSNMALVKGLLKQPPHRANTDSSRFHVDQVSGKGLGLVADRAFHRGDAVMKHAPAFLAHRGFIERTTESEQHDLLELAASLLSSSTRQKFLSQHGHFGGHHISDILATNSFQIDLGGTDGQHFGNYPEVSRFNHDCRPNVAFYIDANLTHHSSVARPISPGEELTISYLNPFEPYASRQKRTQAAWGFACGCSQCRQTDASISESDNRLKRIRDLESKLEDFGARVTMGMVRRLLDLYREERLENKMSGGLTLAALNSNLLGMEQEAKKYALQAIEAGLIEGGEMGDVKAMVVLAEDPKSHFTWGKRLRG